MANGHGGYRQPANPAPVSGPGALSQRTDGRQPKMDLPDAKYGENADFQSIQSGAPLPQTPPAAGASNPAAGPVDIGPPPAPLTNGTLNPTQPVTHGADAGPGADSSSLQLGNPIAAQYQSGISVLQQLSSQPDASPATRALLESLGGGF